MVAMRCIAVAAGVLLVAGVLARSEEQAAEEESPFIYTLEVNGEPHPIEVGKLLTLPAHEGLIKVRLKVAPYRVFRTPGVEFRFPRGWLLDGVESEVDWRLGKRRFRLYVSIERGERDAANVMKREIRRRRRFDEHRRAKVIPNQATLRLAGTEPRQLWLPAEAAAVVVNGKREIPARQIGAKLVID